MNNMVKRFSRSEFLKLLHTTDMNPKNIDNKRLSLAYTRFINRIQTVSKLDSCSRLEALQALARTREILFRLQAQYKDSESLSYQLIRSSLSLINFEKQMICLQLKYPGIRNMHTSRPHSLLKISGRFTNSDLMEVIAALSAVGFFCQQDGSPASFMQITREFETLCNTSFKNPDNCRWAILNRKNRLTHFLDMLRSTLVELSQK